MSEIELIRAKIGRLYKTNPEIHLNVSISSPKLSLTSSRARITGVYPHIFQIEEYTSGEPKRHTVQYAELLIGNVTVSELAR